LNTASALFDLSRLDAADAFRVLESSADGLATEEAQARLRRFGPNHLPQPKGPEPIRQLLAQFVHFFALMLWIAAALAFIGDMPQLAWAIVAVVVVNGIFAFVQEYRADRAASALMALLPRNATALRDHVKRRIPAEELVPGDIVLLVEGDHISADARVVSAAALKVDNSLLTGESEPVERDADASSARELVDTSCLVFAGTHVTSGTGAAVVAATGSSTRFGAISRMTGDVVRRPTPIKLDLNRAVRTIAMLAVAAGVGFFGIALVLGTPARDGFLFGVGVIVALVPEGLLPTLTLSMAMSAKRMAGRRALVRRLEAVETLGATTVICSDKTGTITANQMTARKLSIVGNRYRTSGTGYGPAGTILTDGHPIPATELVAIGSLLRAAALCGDARVERREDQWWCAGDPTEGALLVLARKGGIERETAERAAPRVREFPFESIRSRMSTVHALPSGGLEVLAKGSPEAILRVCTRVRIGDDVVEFGARERDIVRADVDALAGEGLRVIALARRALAEAPSSAEEAEAGLELLGLVGLEDPVRPEVPDAIARCRRAGIRVLMVTGDHPATAGSIARKAGLEDGRVMTGSELPDDDDALADLLEGPVCVLARIPPEDKLRIARALQSRGHVVAMTGDGVNDAPALRQADIGVAMGRSGTDVARETADVILLDDSFAHIVEAVEEGRAAFDNVRRFLTYHLTDNVAELAPFLAWALSGGSIPLALTVLQILALDIGTDLLPALALGAEPPEPGRMSRPPRPRGSKLIDRKVIGRAFGFLGPVQAALSLAMLPLGAALFFGWHPGDPLPAGGVALATLSTMVFAGIVMMQMANAFECRSVRSSLFRIGPFSNRLLTGAVAVEGLALVAFVYLGPLQRALGQHGLSARNWLVIAALPWAFIGAEEGRKAIARQKRSRGINHRGRDASSHLGPSPTDERAAVGPQGKGSIGPASDSHGIPTVIAAGSGREARHEGPGTRTGSGGRDGSR
jgi:magnesium-transporting ATPase (P-type)